MNSKISRCCIAVLLSLIFAFCGLAWAEEKFGEHDLLFLLEEAYTQEQFETQLNNSFAYLQGRAKESEFDESFDNIETKAQKKEKLVYEVEMEFGITDWLEVGGEFAYLQKRVDSHNMASARRTIKTDDDFKSAEVGAKVRVLKEDEKSWLPTFTVGMDALLPAGDPKEEIGLKEEGFEWTVLATKRFTHKKIPGDVTIHANIGFAITPDVQKRNEGLEPSKPHDVREFSYAAAAAWRFTEHWTFLLEYVHEIEEEIKLNKRRSETEIVILPALTFRDEIAEKEELKSSNEELATSNEELRTTTEELENANKEITQAQEKLVRQEKLAALGQLASGVGHELRNPLGVIQNAVYFLKMKVAGVDPKVAKHLDIMEREVANSNKIISDLLTFSRAKTPVKIPQDINTIVQEALEVVPKPEAVRVVKVLASQPIKVPVDRDQIRQVFLNIVGNAYQSMAEGGELKITTQADSDHVQAEFKDTGCGIPQEAVEKIYDPFYTTKAKGIGLGLAVSKDIVERHSGKIQVESKVGVGTTFMVLLPIKA